MKKACKTCRGFGLWAIGDPMPMGQMDAGSFIARGNEKHKEAYVMIE